MTIGLASYLAVLEGLWLTTGRADYMDLFRYWIKNLRAGVRHGRGLGHRHVLNQFGTNWAVFSDRRGRLSAR